MKSKLKKFPLEAVAWIVGLLALFFIDPHSSGHFTICPFHHLGFSFCPGCGLGKSISLLFHGDLAASIATHPLGMFAVVVLLYRIYSLLKINLIYG